jgi:hypothetical protein
MTVEDMVAESEYFREKLRRHNRYLHGWGIVCGLDVTPAGISTAPATVSISAGYALGPYGDEIYVGEPVLLDLSRCGPDAITDPCEPDLLHSRPGVGATVFVAIRYAECLAKPVRAMPAGCACEEEDCEYSRVRDSFEISCLSALPPDPVPTSLCDLRGKPVPCPAPPVSPWVVLAQVTLPAAGSALQIDTTVRQQLFSTSQIQTQVIDCCCGETKQPQPLLQVADVLFRGDNDFVLDVKTSGFFDPQSSTVSTSELTQANIIEVQFVGAKLDPNAVTAKNFQVVDSNNKVVAGTFTATDQTIVWTAQSRAPFRLSSVDYALILIADPKPNVTAIVSQNGSRLDGELGRPFPSGNGAEGGDFKLNFHSS